MARCKYCAQCVEETCCKPAEEKSGDCTQTEDGAIAFHFGTEVQQVPSVERAERVNKKVHTEEARPELCLVPAKIALLLMNRKERKRVENTIRLVSDAGFDAGQLCQHLKTIVDHNRTIVNCNRTLHDS